MAGTAGPGGGRGRDLAGRLRFRAPVAMLGASLCVAALVAVSHPSGARGATGPSAGPARTEGKAWRTPKLTWEPCEGAWGAQCATLWVPLDWSRPRGTQVSLAMT